SRDPHLRPAFLQPRRPGSSRRKVKQIVENQWCVGEERTHHVIVEECVHEVGRKRLYDYDRVERAETEHETEQMRCLLQHEPERPFTYAPTGGIVFLNVRSE